MLNEKIKNLRLSYRLNQVELGKALGVTKQCVSNWENDNIQPSEQSYIYAAESVQPISSQNALGP